jgi:hypothetical protein
MWARTASTTRTGRVRLTTRLFNSDKGAQYPRRASARATTSSRRAWYGTSGDARHLRLHRADILAAYKNWNVAGLQWNPEDTRTERSQFRL